ncbi:cytochrome c [Methyloversatilis sp.]|uniref:c-type cytochrome n=1 Tax=Methyloversatilis sp. TaxID=2569862 RepID=UPI0035AEE87E
MKRTLSGLALALLSLSATTVHSADPNLGRNLAATCANCHGTDGNSVGGMEVLAGMPKGKMLNSLKAFRNGDKPATIMHQISKGYTDAQLDLIADYFSSRKPTGGGK